MGRERIIEDEALLREAYALILKAEGYDVAHAENGEVGLSQLEVFQPDLIFLDMLMPVMGGEAFLQTGQLPVRHPNTKVVIVSNISNPISAEASHSYGVVESLVKANLSPTDLAQIARKYCPV